MLENSDWTCIINPEIQQSTGTLFLTFKLLKRRYRSTEDNHKLRSLTYFNHPFEEGNEIKLIDDIDLPKSISIESLSTVFVAKENDNFTDPKNEGATDRPIRDRDKEKDNDKKTLVKKKPIDEFDDFDFTKAMNF